jgi:transcription initiation factor IIE alpha subunit
MSIVWFDSKENITRETTRAIQENNLIQQDYRKDILLDKIYKDEEYIHTTSTEQTIINDLIQKIVDGHIFTYYTKTTQQEKKVYTTHIRIGDTIAILDIQ